MRDVEVSADGTHIFCLVSNLTMAKPSFRILDVKTGADSTHLYTTPDLGQSVIRHLKSSESGSKFVCIFENGTACIFEVSFGSLRRVILEGRIEEPKSVVFTPDATRLLAVSPSRTIKFWDALTGAPLKIAKAKNLGNSSGVSHDYWKPTLNLPSFAFSPNGTRFCTSSGDCLYIRDCQS